MRAGTFSSSSAYKLVSFGRGEKSVGNVGASFKTYVDQVSWEIKLGRSLQNETEAKETAWGKLLERRVFDRLGLEYQFQANTRYRNGDYHSGMPDTRRDNVVGDIKCPFTLKSFCEAVDGFGEIDEFKAAKPEWYWQLVSNCILTGDSMAEIIVYVPYKVVLEDIKRESALCDGWMGRFTYMDDDELPYLNEGLHYQDLNIFEFEVPQEDKDFLQARIELAIKHLKL